MVKAPRPRTIFNSIVYPRDEVDSEPVVMGGLSRSRFRRSDFQQVCLPLATAMRLKDFEVGLREAGFVGPSECLFQTLEDATVFRVQETKATIDLGTAHNTISNLGFGAEAPSGTIVRAGPQSNALGVPKPRNRLGDEMAALSAKLAAKPRT